MAGATLIFRRTTVDSGHLALLSPSCRLPVAVLALSAPFRAPVACLSLPCRCPVAPLSLPCRFPVAFPAAFLLLSCRFLLLPVVSCRHATFCLAPSCRLLLLSCRSLLLLSSRYFLLPPCRPPVACLSSSCRLPVASLSPPCRLPVAPRGNLSLSCRLPVSCLALACGLPAASLSPPCCLPVASLSPNVVTCRSPVASLPLACRLSFAFLAAPLSPPCRPMCYPIDVKPQTPQTGSLILLKMFFVHAKLSDLVLANLPKGVQSNDANRRSMVQSFALFDNAKFLTPLVIYYIHLHGRSAVGSQPFCKSN